MSPGHVWSLEELASDEKLSASTSVEKTIPVAQWEVKVDEGSPWTQTMVELNNYPRGSQFLSLLPNYG